MLTSRDPVADYTRVFFDRDQDEMRELVSNDVFEQMGNASLEYVQAHFALSGAQRAIDKTLRIDSTVMLVDDPVKRVDNMTMAFGLEARVPFLDHELVELAASCPPELKVAGGGKGVLKAASRGVVPDEIIDRTKGYFPVPAIRHLSGGLLDQVGDALTGRAARERGLYQQDYIARLLDDPNDTRTTLGANALWQFALLEMWLQKLGVA
jgi:asparagine synthase (glutamine-hydrolysing)